MIHHDKVKKYSEDMIKNLDDMEQIVTKFKPKTINYDNNIGDDISASAKQLMDEILKTVKEFKKAVEEKTSGVRNFATKLGNSEKKNTKNIGDIR